MMHALAHLTIAELGLGAGLFLSGALFGLLVAARVRRRARER
jgi:hypothetical protein